MDTNINRYKNIVYTLVNMLDVLVTREVKKNAVDVAGLRSEKKNTCL